MRDGGLMVLSGQACSIALEPVAGGVPLWRHFGALLEDAAGAWPLAGARPLPPNTLDGDPALSVLTTHGLGWFAHPALLGSRTDGGDWAQQFELIEADQTDTGLLLTLLDPVAALRLTLSCTIDATSDVLTCSAEIENLGTTPFRLDWLAAVTVPLPPEAEQVIGFTGRWTLEFQQARERLGVAAWRRDSRRGRNAHDSFPGVIVGSQLADDHGPVWGAHLAWSGNHTILIEPLTDGRRQLQLGEWLAPGEVVLAPANATERPTPT